MANGRALPSAILFDELLARAWERAQRNVNAATSLAMPVAVVSNFAKTDGEYSLKPFDPELILFDAEKTIGAYDKGVLAQLRELEAVWVTEMEQVIGTVVPPSPSYGAAVNWLGRAAGTGQDALGYLGQEHRIQQLKGMQARVQQAGANPRGLPMPPGASAALGGVMMHLTGIAMDNLDAQMAADRASERMAMRIESAEILLRLRTDAISSAIDYVNNRMTAMLDVYGSNNAYRTNLEMDAAVKRATLQSATSALDQHGMLFKQSNAAAMEGVRQVGEINDRVAERISMVVDSYVKRMRRHASRASSALNSAGVTVSSTASESNSVSAEQ